MEPTPLTPKPISISPTVMTPDNVRKFAGLRVVSAREMQQDAWCMLAYAQGGVGKTTLAGMFADYAPARDVLIVDCEGGSTAVSNKDHVDVVQAGKWSEVEAIVRELERTRAEEMQYKTVCFDNLSEMQTMQMQTVTTGTPEIQHWGRNTSELLRFTRRVRDISRFKGVNIVLLAWMDTEEDEYSKKIRHGVALTNKLAKRLPGIVNVVGYMSIVDNPPLYTRLLSFAASPRTDAKFRRAQGDTASDIPLELYYGLDQNPIVDILSTLYEGKEFPTERYTRPKRATTTATPTTPPATE